MFARRILGFGFAVLAALGTAACGGGGGDIAGPGSDTPAPPAPPSAGKGTLHVSNVSSLQIIEISTRACGTEAWGDDLLAYPTTAGYTMDGYTMDPGESASWELDSGCHDVYVHATSYKVDQVVSDVQIEAGKSASVTISSWPASQ